jgi:addiction module RelE/StbE family toxin
VKIRWTRLARKDVDAAYDYVASDNAGAAGQFLERIEQAAAVLVRHPMAGRTGRIAGTRELVIPGTPWILPYRIRRGCIDILAVIHGARKWPESCSRRGAASIAAGLTHFS